MDALKLTFKNGESLQFPFNADSTVSVETPDGPNGVQRGAWGEITDVVYVKDAGEVVDQTVVSAVPAPEPVSEPVAVEPAADVAPAADVPAETVTPDPLVAAPAASDSGSPQTSSESTPTSDTPSDATPTTTDTPAA